MERGRGGEEFEFRLTSLYKKKKKKHHNEQKKKKKKTMMTTIFHTRISTSSFYHKQHSAYTHT